MATRNVRSDSDVPTYDIDLFQPDALRDPFGHYRTIRDLGPVVRLHVPDVLCLSRFEDVQAALRQPDILISGEGVGFNPVMNAPLEEPNLIRSDGERHRRLRGVVSKPLMPAALKERRAMLKAMIGERIDEVLQQGEIDGVTALAQHLPLQAVSHLVGLSADDRSKMLRWASAAFNSLGPHSFPGTEDAQLARDLETFVDVSNYMRGLDLQHLRPGSWAATLFEAVDSGRLERQEAQSVVGSYVLPSLDTTIYAKSNLLFNLGQSPDQWRKLKETPSLVSSAVLEGVRYSAVVRWFSRVAIADYAVGDVFIPKGSRVMLLYGSANRDERHYPEPDVFDVTRNPTDQIGWGTGPHMCVGMHLAKLEMEVMLEALLERVERIEIGQPVLGTNRGLYGIDRLPMTLH